MAEVQLRLGGPRYDPGTPAVIAVTAGIDVCVIPLVLWAFEIPVAAIVVDVPTEKFAAAVTSSAWWSRLQELTDNHAHVEFAHGTRVDSNSPIHRRGTLQPQPTVVINALGMVRERDTDLTDVSGALGRDLARVNVVPDLLLPAIQPAVSRDDLQSIEYAAEIPTVRANLVAAAAEHTPDDRRVFDVGLAISTIEAQASARYNWSERAYRTLVLLGINRGMFTAINAPTRAEMLQRTAEHARNLYPLSTLAMDRVD